MSAFGLALWLAWAALTGATAVHALLHQRQPASAWGWIAIALLLPFLGPWLYFILGMNRIERRARRLRERRGGRRDGRGPGDDPEDDTSLPATLRPVARTGDALTRRPRVGGNTLRLLHDGEQVYPRMLAAIESAQRSIVLMVYIFDPDEVGTRFIDALAAAQARGVDVRCLLDGVGEFGWKRAGSMLLARGLRAVRFNPITFLPPFVHINLRNHRKLMVVDGRLAFAGGMNITAVHLAANTDNPHRATDVQVEIRGPIVAQLADLFAEDWHYAAGEDCPSAADSDEEEAVADGALCRLVTDGPDEDHGKLSLVLLAAIAAARRSIFIVTPYFLPPPDMLSALISAALRGVEVNVILPRVNDQPWTHFAARKLFDPLLTGGVRIAYQPAPFCHAKLFAVDGEYAQFGSANFDARSFRLNFEMMVEVYDPVFTTALETHCRALLAKSQLVRRGRLRAAELPSRLRDSICWLASPYL